MLQINPTEKLFAAFPRNSQGRNCELHYENSATRKILKAATTEAFELSLIGSVLLDAPDGIKAYPETLGTHFVNPELGRMWAAIRCGYSTAQELVDLGHDKSLIIAAVSGAIVIMQAQETRS